MAFKINRLRTLKILEPDLGTRWLSYIALPRDKPLNKGFFPLRLGSERLFHQGDLLTIARGNWLRKFQVLVLEDQVLLKEKVKKNRRARPERKVASPRRNVRHNGGRFDKPGHVLDFHLH